MVKVQLLWCCSVIIMLLCAACITECRNRVDIFGHVTIL